jgi:SnoaL-like domain
MQTKTWLTDLFKSIDTMNTQSFAKNLSDNVIFRFGNAPAIQGRNAVLDTVDSFFKSIRGLHHEIAQSWIQADSVICHGMVTYTRHDGSTLAVPFANIFRLSGKLVSHYLIFVDVSALYAADA